VVFKDLRYDYDAVGNLTKRERHEGVVGTVPYFAEVFGYDAFHRLQDWSGFSRNAGQAVGGGSDWKVAYNYDELGNLANRSTFDHTLVSEVVEETYPTTAGPRPHAMTAMNWSVGSGADRSYQHDNAGRQWRRPGQTIRYTDFDLPRKIRFDGTNREANFWYDADGGRFRKEVWRSENLQDVTTYVGGMYERREQTGSAGNAEKMNVYYIQAGDRTVAQFEVPEGSQAQEKLRYFHQDHLDSVSFTTDANGVMDAPVYNDPYGNRFNPEVAPTLTAPKPAGLPNVTRGFTGHEMEIEDFGLINMKGRMFDPEAGRFLSADPFVQEPLWGQSYNRFMYVMGNPLTYSDPSGFVADQARLDREYADEIEGNKQRANDRSTQNRFDAVNAEVQQSHKDHDAVRLAHEREKTLAMVNRVLNAYPNAKGIRAAEGIINQHLAKNGVAPTGVSTNGQSQETQGGNVEPKVFSKLEHALDYSAKQAQGRTRAEADAMEARGEDPTQAPEFGAAIYTSSERRGFQVGPLVAGESPVRLTETQTRPAQMNIGELVRSAPSGSTVVGLAHSHPTNDSSASAFRTDFANSNAIVRREEKSGAPLSLESGQRVSLQGISIGLPSGRVVRYDPRSREVY